MKRILIILTAATSLVVVAAPGGAAADGPGQNTSYASAATVTPGSGIVVQPTSPGGAIGGLLDFVSPVLDQILTPLTDDLTSLPSTLIAGVVTGLTGSGYTANSPSASQSPPANGYPDCASAPWTSDDCFGPLVPSISAAPLLSAATGTLQGYAAADATGSYAAAQTAGIQLSALGVSLGSLGVASSSSQCLASRVCSSTASLTGLSLLNGTVAAKTGSDGSLQIALNGSSTYVPLTNLVSPVTLTGAGVSATATPQGGSLRVSVSLTLDNLLAALGIPDVLSSLNTADAGSSVTLTLTIGPGTSPTADSATAWGLEVGLGLSANVQLSVLGLVTVGAGITDNSATGDLVDLRLAYTSAANTDAVDPSGAPPDLT